MRTKHKQLRLSETIGEAQSPLTKSPPPRCTSKKTENVKKSVNIGIKRLPGSKLSSFFTLACLIRTMSELQTARINSCQSKRRIFHKIQDTQASNHKHPGFDVSTPESSNGTFPSLEARSSTELTALCGTSLGAWLANG